MIMCVSEFRDLCNNYRFYNFSTPEDYDKGIDYNGDKIEKYKYHKKGIIKNPSGVPTYWQGYGLK